MTNNEVMIGDLRKWTTGWNRSLFIVMKKTEAHWGCFHPGKRRSAVMWYHPLSHVLEDSVLISRSGG